MAIVKQVTQTSLACGIGLLNGALLTGLVWIEREAYVPWPLPLALILVALLILSSFVAALFRRQAAARSLFIVGLVTLAAFYAGLTSVRYRW